MYPLPAVLVNVPDPTVVAIRAALNDHGVAIAEEFASPDALLAKWPAAPDTTRRMFVVRLGSLDDVTKLGHLDACFPGWPVLAMVEGEYDSTSLLRVSRAGAAQIVPLPLRQSDIDTALDRLLIQFALRESPCRVVAVSGVVEGCGSTTVAVNLAAELAAVGGQPCVLTEMAFGMGRLAALLNLSPTITTRDLAGSALEPNSGTVKAALVRVTDHLSVLAGQSKTLEPFVPPPGRLAQLFRLVRQTATFVVLDMSYNFDPHYFEALGLSDQVLLVARQDVPAIESAMLIKQALADRGVVRPALALNRFDPHQGAFSCEAVGELLGVERVFPVAPDPTGLRLAANSGRLLRDVVPGSATVLQTRAIAEMVLRDTGFHPHLPRVTLWERVKTLLARVRA